MIINPYRFGVASNSDFITEWTVGDGDAAARTITLFGHQGTTYNSYDIDWGDSQTETGITTIDKTHEYAVAGVYKVTITDQFGGLGMWRSPQANRDKLTKFVNWGESEINGCYGMFYGCGNMLYEATDAPDLTNLISQYATRFDSVFYNCSSIVNLDLSGWDASSFIQMYETFRGLDNCKTLNISGWTLPNVTTLYQAFYEVGKTSGCDLNLSNVTMALAGLDAQKAFRYTNFSTNPNFTNFDISGADNIKYFMDLSDGASSHIDLSDLDFTNAVTALNNFGNSSKVGSVTFGSGSDFSSVTDLTFIFMQVPNMTSVTFPSNCDFSSVTTFHRGFYNNPGVSISNMTTIDLGAIQDFGLCTNWGTFRGLGVCSINFLTTTNIQSTTALSDLLYTTTIQTSEYNNLLIALSTANGVGNPPNINGNLNGGSSTYDAAPEPGGAARDILSAAGWVFADGGPA